MSHDSGAALDPLETQKRNGQGLAPGTGLGQGLGTRAQLPLLWFLKILRLPPGLQRMNTGPQFLIYEEAK